ncbi:hypothetical protein Pflav_089180 [Phytohabitans flavus]|uniref:Uncharacterized protein n=1 Tax=Phytohabitans flavus TaxID=1076124 RepID=A0A6F8Y948_9ACTN|nr:hypothetical protein [Phytohabitans flavus]BCB82508.1 hypothetical protein Pflav_089180 [Phytohabitans flavus]
MSERFTYYVLYRRDLTTPVGLLAEGQADPALPHRVVGWDHQDADWTEAQASLGAMQINPDYEDRLRIVDRSTAERIARETLGTQLPTEEELQAIGDRAAEEYARKWGPAGS